MITHMNEGDFRGNDLAVVCIQTEKIGLTHNKTYEVMTGFSTMEEARKWSDTHKYRECTHVLGDWTELK